MATAEVEQTPKIEQEPIVEDVTNEEKTAATPTPTPAPAPATKSDDNDDNDGDDDATNEEEPSSSAAISDDAAASSAISAAAAAAAAKQHQSRAEKKNRKAMAKFGMQPFSGVMRITMKRGRSFMLVFSQPEVYKSGDTYMIFGEAKFEDSNSQLQQNAAQQLRAAQAQFSQQKAAQDFAAASAASTGAAAAAAASGSSIPSEAAAGAASVNTEGLDEKDIELVVNQSGRSREEAIVALKKANGDIVNAIMELAV